MGSSQIPIFLLVFLQTDDSPKLSLWVLIRLGMRHMSKLLQGEHMKEVHMQEVHLQEVEGLEASQGPYLVMHLGVEWMR